MSKKIKMSGPAIFMHSIIALMIIISTICFWMYYGEYTQSEIVLWTGITAFTIMYHFWVRIIMGNVSKLFKKHVSYNQWWFKEKMFEKKLYKILNVKNWKRKILTYNPEFYNLKTNSLEEIANTMVKSELDHWINEIISLSTLLFAISWGEFWIFFVTALAAMIFDSQFIIVQRYNRPRVLKALNRKNNFEEKVQKQEVKI